MRPPARSVRRSLAGDVVDAGAAARQRCRGEHASVLAQHDQPAPVSERDEPAERLQLQAPADGQAEPSK
jgi:hypothetical protein